ncbi:uncharacterized protein H6S33_006662 [Morchella sextelata]|uniref:uncharacterized protein n=1 Tax=Morchella sextelata TaxID=1174677 RepID=UPI001D039C09|nr:uncharacterized protein H6S33_006662 [Morchella sextelata]KAH0604285.1 hypothetical protein H6S33_006662 [Morchella sextelata]
MSSNSLYGAPRPKSKANPIPLSSTSIHALANELTLARARLSSTSTTKTAPGRTRPSKTKALFAPSNKGVSKRAARDETPNVHYGGQTIAQRGGGVSERDLERSRKKLKEKSRLYAAMKRGDFADEGGEGLVDFDRKWAEHPSDESDEEGEEEAGGDDDDDDEIIEYEDEFGRTRKGKRGVVEREKRRVAAAKRAAEEAAAMNAVPEGLIVGNTIQTAAFTTATFSAVPSSAMLAGAMPKEEEETKLHYDATKEVRTKGVGFYQFSRDEKGRMAEMEELERLRLRTTEERKKVEEKKKKRKEAVEKKREEVQRRRREKVGDKWLEGFMGELAESPAAPASADQGEVEEES